MEDFLYELGRIKYQFKQTLYEDKPYALTEYECFERIKEKAGYMMLLDVIELLPIQQSQEFKKMEEFYFKEEE